MDVRAAEESEVDQLATLWFDGWTDAHARIVPAELKRLRTLESFRSRLKAGLASVRVAGPPGMLVGFHMLKADEIYQLYVASQARGTGVAAALMADAEACLRARGVQTAWLGCAIGNDRAAKFYEKSGWRRIGTVVEQLETTSGPFPFEAWRYEKRLAPERS